MAKQTGIVTITLFLLSCAGWAQNNHYDVSATVGPVISEQSSGNGTVLAPTSSGALVAVARVRLSERLSVAADFGRTKNSQMYSVSPNEYRVQGPITEFGGLVLFSFWQGKKFETFALGGMSALVFTPKVTVIDGVSSNLPVHTQTKPAPVYGLGFDYHVYHRFSVRVLYRGLFYKAPDFTVPNFFTGAYGHMAEPTAGLVFKF